MIMQIFKVSFKRTKNSPWENGIMIEGEKDSIFDKEGNYIKNLWNFERDYYEFCIDLSSILNQKNYHK